MCIEASNCRFPAMPFCNSHLDSIPVGSEAKHLDTGKTALQYVLVFKGLDEVAKVGEFGAKKYGQFNYKAGASYMRFLGSCTRHLAAFIRGEDTDAESGLSHLAHLVFDALMLLDWLERKVGTDDRYRTNS